MILNQGTSEEFGMEHKNWQPGEKRINKICFIGRNLDRKELEDEVKACIFDGKIPEPGPIPTAQLKFKKGDTVMCNMGMWVKGLIVKEWYREELWPTGKYAPYQVVVNMPGDKPQLIYVPKDHPAYIRPFDAKALLL